jgi:hypothetical protein
MMNTRCLAHRWLSRLGFGGPERDLLVYRPPMYCAGKAHYDRTQPHPNDAPDCQNVTASLAVHQEQASLLKAEEYAS